MKQALDDRKHQPSLPNVKLKPDIDKHGQITDVLPARAGTDGADSQGTDILQGSQTFHHRNNSYGALYGAHLFGDKRYQCRRKSKTSEEKIRLRRPLIESIGGQRIFFIIIRTSAEGKRVTELNHELRTLLQCWKTRWPAHSVRLRRR